jgi:uncharacterized RDD family membrane protein YckC
MKCPKCGYVGFEATARCRHCGYDFALAVPAAMPVATVAAAPRAEVPAAAPLRDRPAAVAEIAVPDEAPLEDLPLRGPAFFTAAERFADPPPPARTPLAVRRTADRPRSRTTTMPRRPRPVLLDVVTEDAAAGAVPDDGVAAPPAAPAVARLLSAALDLLLLAGIDAAVVYLTAQMAGVAVTDVAHALPLAPLATFVLGLNIAYLAVFTANGGQTLGKMAAGLRVESTAGRLTFGDAVVRVVVAVVGGLAMGAGFLPALWRADRRAVHDQVAHTRVVRVGQP